MNRAAPARAAQAAAAAALLAVLAACGGGQEQQAPQNSPSGSPTGNAATSNPGTGRVDRQQAGRIVTDKYGGRVINVETDTEKGQPTWEVEVKGSRQGRIEVDVSRNSGRIVKIERD